MQGPRAPTRRTQAAACTAGKRESGGQGDGAVAGWNEACNEFPYCNTAVGRCNCEAGFVRQALGGGVRQERRAGRVAAEVTIRRDSDGTYLGVGPSRYLRFLPPLAPSYVSVSAGKCRSGVGRRCRRRGEEEDETKWPRVAGPMSEEALHYDCMRITPQCLL